ncbi:hypothetical protein CSB09_03810 [Candidatus Gracilibacteria bacterium]|nr:MAG: hypothetical protein CSB09_03810 [Candidatus Gracilibacteria bacterium]
MEGLYFLVFYFMRSIFILLCGAIILSSCNNANTPNTSSGSTSPIEKTDTNKNMSSPEQKDEKENTNIQEETEKKNEENENNDTPQNTEDTPKNTENTPQKEAVSDPVVNEKIEKEAKEEIENIIDTLEKEIDSDETKSNEEEKEEAQ